MKKILILTVSAGNAHNACAQTVQRLIGARAQTEIVDLFRSFSPRRYAWFSGRGYELAVEKLLPVYNLFYEHYRKADPEARYTSATQGACLSAVAGLLKKLAEFRPDAVFCTHYNCAVALTDLKLAYPLPCFIVSTCLDYTLSPFWESAIGVDRMILPSEELIAPCLQKGYRHEQLLPYGLPVNVRFLSEDKKKPAEDGRITVLVLFGGGTWGGVEKLFRATARALHGEHARVIVINGKNAKSYRKIARARKKYDVPVENVGYTDVLPEYFARADIVINKCGGASAAEMLAAGLPMLIWERLPAQEKYNLHYLKEHGAARSFRGPRQLKRELLQLLHDEELRRQMAQRAFSLACSGAIGTAELLLSAPPADWTDFEKIDFSEVKTVCKKALKRAHRDLRGLRGRRRPQEG